MNESVMKPLVRLMLSAAQERLAQQELQMKLLTDMIQSDTIKAFIDEADPVFVDDFTMRRQTIDDKRIAWTFEKVLEKIDPPTEKRPHDAQARATKSSLEDIF